MLKISRIYLAYLLVGGLIANFLMNPIFRYDAQNSDLAIYIGVLTTLTTFITGLLVTISIHRYLNSGLYRFLQKKNGNDELYQWRKKVALFPEFSDSLGYPWGNLILSLLIIMMFIGYLIQFGEESFETSYGVINDILSTFRIFDLKPIFENFTIPYIDPKESGWVLIGLLAILSVLIFDTFIVSFPEMNRRLEWYAYYQYCREKNRGIKSVQKDQIVKIHKQWVEKFRKNMNVGWALVEDDYEDLKFELYQELKKFKTSITRVCEEYTSRQNPIEYLNLGSPESWNQNRDLKSFWNFREKTVKIIDGAPVSSSQVLKIRRIETIIPLSLRKEFNRIILKIEKIYTKRKEYEVWGGMLISETDYGVLEKNDFWRGEDRGAILKKLLVIEQLSKDFFNQYVSRFAEIRELVPQFDEIIDDAFHNDTSYGKLTLRKIIEEVIRLGKNLEKLYIELCEDSKTNLETVGAAIEFMEKTIRVKKEFFHQSSQNKLLV